MRVKKWIAFALCFAMALSLLTNLAPVARAEETPQTQTEAPTVPGPQETEKTELTAGEREAILAAAQAVAAQKIDRDSLDVDLTGSVQLDDALLKSMQALKPDEDLEVPVLILMNEDSVIEENSAAVPSTITLAKAGELENSQDAVIASIERNVLDAPLEVHYQYTWLLNGIAATVPYGKISEIENLPGVDRVIVQPVYYPMDSEVQPLTDQDGGMIGRYETWETGYTGKGLKIAVIDSGLDDDHPNFAPLPEDRLTSTSATVSTIEAVLTQLHAYESYRGLSAQELYRTTKVPYAFNYVDNELRYNHADGTTTNPHGTHVAGIAAANKIEGSDVVGVAPDAQLYIMKIFHGSDGAMTQDILAALEDALLLGADVINMSLGTTAGFSSSVEEVNEIYARVSTTDTVLSIAAGNSATSGYQNLFGTNASLTSNPDNSTISSPSTYQSALSVASVENVAYRGYYLEVAGKHYSFYEGTRASTAVATFQSLSANGPMGYAVVGNMGQTLEDFTKAGVEGKIALVERGVTSFSNKCELAEAAGAIGCLVYNNDVGTFGMAMSDCTAAIPCACVTRLTGQALISALESDPAATMTVAGEPGLVPNDAANQMSSFSSWGVSPDLALKPDISAPGGEIYSTMDGGRYDTMSGTSMAAPNLSGISALLMQYVRDQLPQYADGKGALHDFANALLMSTAVPLTYNGNGVYFSPRQQGSGMANAYKAVTAPAYLEVPGMDLPKVELKDDPAKTGHYHYTFLVHNFSGKPQYYVLSTNVQTESVSDEGDGNLYMGMTPQALTAQITHTADGLFYTYDYNENGQINSHDAYLLWRVATGKDPLPDGEEFRYDLLGNGGAGLDDVQAYLDELVGIERTDAEDRPIDLWEQSLQVGAGAVSEVGVDITLSDVSRQYMDRNFANGIYVEGFTVLRDQTGGVDLSLPYMGFYGDWYVAPMLDYGYYYQTTDEMAESGCSQYPNILWTQLGDNGADYLLGLNPYVNEDYDPAHASISPNGDGYVDYLDDIYVSLLRNAKELTVSYILTGTDTVLSEEIVEHVGKTYYSDTYQQMVPYIHSWYFDPFDLIVDGEPLPNDTKVTLRVEAVPDYDKGENENVHNVWETEFVIDTQAPELVGEPRYAEVDGQKYLVVTVRDNVSVAAVSVLSKLETVVWSSTALDDNGENVTKDETGLTYTDVIIPITGYGNELTLVLGDYACNEQAYYLETEDNDPVLDQTKLYGYRINDTEYTNEAFYGWLAIDPVKPAEGDNANVQVLDSEAFMDYSLISAAYVDGYIIAEEASSHRLVWLKPGYWDERHSIATLPCEVRAMTFDATTGKLYGVAASSPPGYGRLMEIDPITGASRYIGRANSLISLWALTCDGQGNLYGLDNTGKLRLINKTSGIWGETVIEKVETEAVPTASYNSIYFDVAENCIYLAIYSHGTEGALYRIDMTDNYPTTRIGTIAGNAQIVGLTKLDDRGWHLPEAELESIAFTQESVDMLVGTTEILEIQANPWYASPEKLTWASANPEIVSVSTRGVLTAKSVGQTTVTATYGSLTATTTVTVLEPQGQLTGFIQSSSDDSLGLINQWVDFPAVKPSTGEVLTDISFTTFTAGEYVDGKVYAFDNANAFYSIDMETMEATRIANGTISVYMTLDMAYDYKTGFLYLLALDPMAGYLLYQVDVLTGIADPVTNVDAVAITFGPDGTMYAINMTGMLVKMDPMTGEQTPIGYTGFTPAEMSTNSLAYDLNTDELYWAMTASNGTGDYFGISYVNLRTGKASYLGAVDAEQSMSCLFSAPETVPQREEVPVAEVIKLTDSTLTLTDHVMALPVQVKPYNATNRTLNWTVADPSVAKIEDNLLVGLSAGTTTATGTLDDFSVTLDITVKPAAGSLRGFVVMDFSGMGQGFWARIVDFAPNESNEGLVGYKDDTITAGEYFNGKIYAYGTQESDYSYDGTIFYVIDANTFEIEKQVKDMSIADIHDMAFDYTQGVMYAVGGQRYGGDPDRLYCVDINTGLTYQIAQLDDLIGAVACDDKGQLYGTSITGTFYKIDKVTGALEKLSDLGYPAYSYTSMAFDHNTGNLYWAQSHTDFMTYTQNGTLLLLDPETGNSTNLGPVGLVGCMVTSLYTVPKTDLPVGSPNVSSISLNSTAEVLAPGGTFQLTAQAMPVGLAGISGSCAFTSSNPAVATVSETGLITALAGGVATITVTSGSASAEFSLTVLDPEKELIASGYNQLFFSKLVSPTEVTETVDLPMESLQGVLMCATYNGKDGYLYGIVGDGQSSFSLAKLTVTGEAVRVGEDLMMQIMMVSSGDISGCQVADISYNPFDQKLYVLVMTMDMNGMPGGRIYEIDPATGNLTFTANVTGSAATGGMIYPTSFTFVNETEYLVYDMVAGGFLRNGLDGSTRVLAPFREVSGMPAMAYSKELNTVYVAFASSGAPMMTLSPTTGDMSEVTEGMSGDVVDLLFPEGVAPAESLNP